ncbi:MAG: hypothetical protein BGO76_08730 [Caedibacter sp. 38-128]|nr:thioredoxin domain-containing protein [Holosporales bacterium]OJX07651.1 MAG: hypothetical protein BGO76_08730 [Caedibacter sp. 38-128]
MSRKFFIFLIFCFISHGSTEKALAEKQKQVLVKAEDIPEIVVGKDTAPITIIEYSSLTCGHCAEFHVHTWPQLEKKYIDSGKVKFIFRHFPTDATALKATAILIHVPLPRQPQVLQQTFKTQAQWIETKDFKELCRICGLEEKFCEQLIKNPKVLDAIIKKRVIYEKALPIEGTPTFIINGKVYAKDLKLPELEKILNGPVIHAK